MATQISSSEIKKYLIESNPYIIIETRNVNNVLLDTQKVVFEDLIHNKIMFEFGEYNKIDVIFISNDEKNDCLEIECYKDLIEESDDDLFVTLKSKQRANISIGGDSLVPGEYFIKLIRKNKTYELLYKITSTNINNDKLNAMREVVDNFLTGLSKNKNTNSLVVQDKNINYTLSKLILNPIVDITKDRFGKKIITNDNMENRILKSILQNIRINNADVGYINFVLENTWLKNIKASKTIKPTLRLLKEKNYSQIYDIFMNNMKEKNIPYKRTSVIFEIYAFISVINILEELDFKWVSGWIKDNDINDLDKGEVVIFKKEEITIKLSFDKELKEISNVIFNKYSEESQICANRDIPCNKPDVLIEVYNGDTLIDCMIIEAKYRKQKNIDNLYNNMSKQLLSYRRFDYFDANTKKISNIRPVSKIIVFYPKQDKEREEHYIYEDIVFLPTDARENQNELKLEILTFIENNKSFDNMNYNENLFVAVTT